MPGPTFVRLGGCDLSDRSSEIQRAESTPIDALPVSRTFPAQVLAPLTLSSAPALLTPAPLSVSGSLATVMPPWTCRVLAAGDHRIVSAAFGQRVGDHGRAARARGGDCG